MRLSLTSSPLLMTSLLLVMLSFPCAAQITQSSVVSEMQLRILHNGTVEAPTFRLEKASFNLLMPQRDVNQVVGFDGEIKKDDRGNSWIYLEQRNPPRVFHYSKEFFVNVSEVRTSSIPQTYEIPDDVKVYLRPTDGIQSDDPAIRGLAESITNNSRTDFERISMLAVWVYDKVNYTRSLGNESKDAVWVLENRVGTCDEFATLFIALVRSIEIPARFVAGYYYGNGRWEEHAFSEVYLGKWIPVDPTNLEVGGIDAAHIKFAVSNENIVGNRIRIQGADADRIDWQYETQISILNYTERKKLDYELLINSDEFFPGGSAVVVLRIKPEEYAFLRASLQPCISDFPFVEVDVVKRDVVLEPGKEKIIFWRLDLAEDLNENMLYSCPLVLNSKFLELGEVVLNVDTKKAREMQDIGLRAELSDKKIGHGRNETLFLHVKTPSASPLRIGVISGDYLREFSISGGEHMAVSFRPEGLGRQSVLIYSSTGSVLTLDYEVEEVEGVYIDRIELPSMVRRGEEAAAEVWIKNDRASPQELKLYMGFDSEELIRSLSVGNQSTVEIPFNFEGVGLNKLVFRIRGSDIDAETMREIRVYDVPELRISALYMPHKQKATVTLDVRKDIARNITVKIDNETRYLSELIGVETLEFDMYVMNPELTVVYEDLSGERYSLKGIIETKEEGLLEKLFRVIGESIRALLGPF